MELVTIDGYTEDDKVAIARDYLLPRQRERAALTTDEVTVTDAALRKIAANYTGEPGVRQFERLLAKALRKVDHQARRRPDSAHDRCAGSGRLPWAAAVYAGVCRAHRGAGCGDRSGRDGPGR